jgi:multidrug resistance efflux pump
VPHALLQRANDDVARLSGEAERLRRALAGMAPRAELEAAREAVRGREAELQAARRRLADCVLKVGRGMRVQGGAGVGRE